MWLLLLRVVIRIPPKKEGKREICVCLCVMCVTKSSEMMSRERTSISAQPAEAQHASFYIYICDQCFPIYFRGLCGVSLGFCLYSTRSLVRVRIMFPFDTRKSTNQMKQNEMK